MSGGAGPAAGAYGESKDGARSDTGSSASTRSAGTIGTATGAGGLDRKSVV